MPTSDFVLTDVKYLSVAVLILGLALAVGGCADRNNSHSTHATDTSDTVDGELTYDIRSEQLAAGDNAAAAADNDKILRHAVFFKFKDSAADAEVQQVVDAFRALPDKIDTIVDFECGTNNSPEGLNDEFTHCFLLSFQDDAGRAVYLPHEAHKAFGNVLRPHMEKVFVVDYWGDIEQEKLDRPLRHMIFLKFKDDAPQEDVQAVIDGFAALPEKIDTIQAFEWGTNNSPENHAAGFTHAFMVTFDSEEGRKAYLPHPEHEAFVEVLKPVLDKVRVIDFWGE